MCLLTAQHHARIVLYITRVLRLASFGIHMLSLVTYSNRAAEELCSDMSGVCG